MDRFFSLSRYSSNDADPCIVTDPSEVQLERSRKQDQFFLTRYLLDQRSVVLTMGFS